MAPPVTHELPQPRASRNRGTLHVLGLVLTSIGALIAILVLWVAITAVATGVPIVNPVTYGVRTAIFLMPLVVGVVLLVVSRRQV